MSEMNMFLANEPSQKPPGNMNKYLMPLLALFLPLMVQAESEQPPNIVFVLFDDMGYGQPPSYRKESTFKTPNIDHLTKRGMLFSDAHSAAASCTPTRYGILTGRYPSRIGQFGVLNTYSPPIIPQTRLAVASFLKKQGYHTACIGKWHLGMNWIGGKRAKAEQLPIAHRMTGGPNALGFDYFYGFTHARNIETIIEQDKVVAHVKGVDNQPLMIKEAIVYIGERSTKKKPFFLYFPMCPPHKPVVPAPSFIGKSRWPGKGAYGDWVYQGDHMLGQIMDELKKTGQDKNTLLIATGDNGAAGGSYPPGRAHKGSIYEGGHREPFVACWPGKIAPGSVCHHTICLNDFFATCSDILKAPVPDNAAEDSISLLPILLGKATKSDRQATIHRSHNSLAIRKGEWKLIFHRSGNRELFRLDSDISETRDVAGENSQIVQDFSQLLQSYIDRGRSTPCTDQKNDFNLSLSFENGKKKKKEQN